MDATATPAMINPKDYKSGKSRPLMFNIRLSKKGAKPTRDEVVAVLETMLATQRVPAGWKFAAINWRDPRKGSTSWRTGSLATAFSQDGLGRVIEAALDSARVAVVRKSATVADEVDDELDDDYEGDFDE